MGDRGNVIVKDGGSTVYLYTHWTGSDLPGVLAVALERGRDRWTDGPYLARIIFCEMVRGSENDTTGFGISATYGDGGTDITVDIDKQQVSGRLEYGADETVLPFDGWVKQIQQAA